MTAHVSWREVAQSYPCPDCDAAPGERCITRTGHDSFLPHAERTRLASAHGWRHADDELAARRQPTQKEKHA